MKKFTTVLKFELKEYLGNKTFMVLTVLLAALGAILLFLPRFVDMSGFTGVTVMEKETSGDEEKAEEEKDLFLYLDQSAIVREEVLEAVFPEVKWQKADRKSVV